MQSICCGFFSPIFPVTCRYVTQTNKSIGNNIYLVIFCLCEITCTVAQHINLCVVNENRYIHIHICTVALSVKKKKNNFRMSALSLQLSIDS